jgi:colanic acid/amylovoran biosynthesis glycosyltransferase
MRVAFFVGSFPEISETFILRQITGLIDLGHEVDIYAEGRPTENAVMHYDVIKYDLLQKTTYMVDHMPEASGCWEMPVWPISGETWIPGKEAALSNWKRAEEATPHLIACLSCHPRLTFEALDSTEYGIEAESFSALYRLSALLKQTKQYDVLHAHFGPNGNSFRFARELWKAPFIVTFHGYDMCTIPRNKGKDVYRRLFDTVDLVTAHSQYAKKLLEGLNCPVNKIRRLNVGVDLGEFSFRERRIEQDETIRVLSVARLVEIKGLTYSITAIAEVRRTFANVRYDIIGEGPERTKLEQLIRELELLDVVKLHGSRDSKYVKTMMEAAHIFALPSISLHGDQEGTPVSLMEAQASGLPVVASRTGGIQEVIKEDESGVTFEEKNVLSLTNQLLYLIENSEKWPQMGEFGRRHVEKNYDVVKLNDELVTIYTEAIQNYSQV